MEDFKTSYIHKPYDCARNKHYKIVGVCLRFFTLVKHLNVRPRKALIWLKSKMVFVQNPASAALFSNLDDKTREWKQDFEGPLGHFSMVNANVDTLYPHKHMTPPGAPRATHRKPDGPGSNLELEIDNDKVTYDTLTKHCKVGVPSKATDQRQAVCISMSDSVNLAE